MDTKRSSRVYANSDGLFDMICNNYSATKVIDATGYFSKTRQMTVGGFTQHIKEVVNAHYLYLFTKKQDLTQFHNCLSK